MDKDCSLQQIEAFGYDYRDEFPGSDEYFLWFSRLLEQARKNFTDEVKGISGYHDERYALLRSFGPLGDAVDEVDVEYQISGQTSEGDRKGIDLRDPFVYAGAEMLLDYSVLRHEECESLYWIEDEVNCESCGEHVCCKDRCKGFKCLDCEYSYCFECRRESVESSTCGAISYCELCATYKSDPVIRARSRATRGLSVRPVGSVLSVGRSRIEGSWSGFKI